MPEKLAQCIIVCGHYGAGKTNLTVNLALLAAGAGERVTGVDMDIVNPYFRTADHQELFLDAGIRLIAPVYANTNLDLPVLPPSVTTAIRSGERVFLDVGGDDDGAVVLGGFSSILGEQGYSMLYVVNRCRELEPDPVQEAQLLERVRGVYPGGLPAHRGAGALPGGGAAAGQAASRQREAAGDHLCKTTMGGEITRDGKSDH